MSSTDQQGSSLDSFPTSPPLYPHFNRPSGFWPCVKSCLVGRQRQINGLGDTKPNSSISVRILRCFILSIQKWTTDCTCFFVRLWIRLFQYLWFIHSLFTANVCLLALQPPKYKKNPNHESRNPWYLYTRVHRTPPHRVVDSLNTDIHKTKC